MLSEPAWSVKGGSISLERPVVIGILNLTPDSFSDGGMVRDEGGALDLARAMSEAEQG